MASSTEALSGPSLNAGRSGTHSPNAADEAPARSADIAQGLEGVLDAAIDPRRGEIQTGPDQALLPF